MYFHGVKTELKKVIWPSKKEGKKYTIVVLAVCAVTAALLWAMDTAFLSIIKLLI